MRPSTLLAVALAASLLAASNALSIESPTALQGARQLYGSSDLTLQPVPGGDFAAAFPDVTRYAVVVEDGLPGDTHTMTWDGTNALDATTGYNSLLALSGAVVGTGAEALKYARAYAEVANAEVQPVRRVVTSADSAALGVTIANPGTTIYVAEGRIEARFWTWSETNGVIASWKVSFVANSITTASWSVTHTAAGPATLDLRAADLRVGHSFTNTYSGTSHAVSGTYDGLAVALPNDVIDWDEITEARRTNFDGSVWVVNYPAAISSPVPNSVTDAARAAADAGVYSYDRQVSHNRVVDCEGASRWNPSPTNWTFEHADPDCQLDILMGDWYSLRCIACVYGDRIYVSPIVKETIQALGYYHDQEVHTVERLMRQVVGHEHFHVLQFDAGVVGHGFYMEGMARFQQTLLDRDTETHASSLWYGTADADTGPNGVNYFARHANLSMCPYYEEQGGYGAGGDSEPYHSYDYGLYWGYLYDQDGGIGTIKLIHEKLDTWSLDLCDRDVALLLDEALAERPGAHDTHAAAILDFGVALYGRDLSWGTPDSAAEYDWGEHLFEVSTLDAGNIHVGAWGFGHVAIPANGTYDVQATLVDDGDTADKWTLRVLRTTANGVESTPFAIGSTLRVTTTGDEAPLVQAVRVWPKNANLTVTVTAVP